MMRFVCNTVPALGIGLQTGLFTFQHGALELEDERDIDAIRRHPWFGSRILQQDAPPAPDPAEVEKVAATVSKLVEEVEGGFRCRECRAASPLFPTVKAVEMHLRRLHKVQATPVAQLIRTREG